MPSTSPRPYEPLRKCRVAWQGLRFALRDKGVAYTLVVSLILLAIAFTLGIGLPFILLSAGFGWASASVDFIRKNIRTVNLIGGGLLIVLGVLMATGWWQILIGALQEVTGTFVPSI